jgi:hypothetical protein
MRLNERLDRAGLYRMGVVRRFLRNAWGFN